MLGKPKNARNGKRRGVVGPKMGLVGLQNKFEKKRTFF
jgi:hypothetical protein